MLRYEVPDTCIGKFANSFGNARGDLLRQWFTSQRTVLANTMFEKRWGMLWTHRHGDRERQIDYLGVSIWWPIQDASICKHVDIGADHHAVTMTLDFRVKTSRKR